LELLLVLGLLLIHLVLPLGKLLLVLRLSLLVSLLLRLGLRLLLALADDLWSLLGSKAHYSRGESVPAIHRFYIGGNAIRRPTHTKITAPCTRVPRDVE
jgi:hypothetical protein